MNVCISHSHRIQEWRLRFDRAAAGKCSDEQNNKTHPNKDDLKRVGVVGRQFHVAMKPYLYPNSGTQHG